MKDSDFIKLALFARRHGMRFDTGCIPEYYKDPIISFGDCNIFLQYWHIAIVFPISVHHLVNWGDPYYLQMSKLYRGLTYDNCVMLKIANSYVHFDEDFPNNTDMNATAKAPLKTNIFYGSFMLDYNEGHTAIRHRYFDTAYIKN